MPLHVSNLYANLPATSSAELFDELFASPTLRIERIASYAQPSPAGTWYDQDLPEWVMLVRGIASLAFEGGPRLELCAGDHLLIPAHRRHRVESTSQDAVWLAVHLKGGE